MKVYVAYYYFSGWQFYNGQYRHYESYQLIGIFSTYEKAFNSFPEKNEDYLECSNTECYETYVDEYGVIEELTLDELLNRDKVTIY